MSLPQYCLCFMPYIHLMNIGAQLLSQIENMLPLTTSLYSLLWCTMFITLPSGAQMYAGKPQLTCSSIRLCIVGISSSYLMPKWYSINQTTVDIALLISCLSLTTRRTLQGVTVSLFSWAP